MSKIKGRKNATKTKHLPAVPQAREQLPLAKAPDYLKQLAGKHFGLEESDTQRDIIIPRLRLLQATSQDVRDKAAEAGTFQHSLTREVYGNQIRIIPLLMHPTRIKWEVGGAGLRLCWSDNARECTGGERIDVGAQAKEGKGKVVQHGPQICAECPDAQPGADRKGEFVVPVCNFTYNFIVLLDGRTQEGPIALAMPKIQQQPAKQLLSLARFSNLPLWTKIYELGAITKTFRAGQAYQITVRSVDFVPQGLLNQVSEWYKAISQNIQRVKVDLDDLPDELEVN